MKLALQSLAEADLQTLLEAALQHLLETALQTLLVLVAAMKASNSNGGMWSWL
jgi:hypothetical protein